LATGHEAALSSPSSPADHIIRVPHSSRSDEDVGGQWDGDEGGMRRKMVGGWAGMGGRVQPFRAGAEYLKVPHTHRSIWMRSVSSRFVYATINFTFNFRFI